MRKWLDSPEIGPCRRAFWRGRNQGHGPQGRAPTFSLLASTAQHSAPLPTPNSSHNPPCPPQSPAIAISQPRSMIFPPTGAVSSTPPTSATHGTALPSSPRPADTHKRKCQQHTLHLGCYSRSFKVASSPLQSRRPPPRHDTRPLGRQKAM